MNDIWSAVSAISSVVNTVIVLVAAIFAVKQIKEATKARYISVMLELFKDMHQDTTSNNRQFIYSNTFGDYKTTLPETQVRVESVINLYQRIAYLASKELVPSEFILDMYSGTYKSVWQKLENYIETRRKETNVINYAKDFEEFARKAIEYRFNKFGEDKTAELTFAKTTNTHSPGTD